MRCLSYLSYIRKGKTLSQTNVDISLVWQLYNIGAHGRHITAATVREKIKDLTRAWDATEVEAQIKKINSLLETPLNDILLALFLAANKTRRVPLKDWENWEKGIQRIVQLLPKSA